LHSAPHRFLLIRDDFYEDPGRVRDFALGQSYEEPEDVTGYQTSKAYHPPGIRHRLETILGTRITRWDEDPGEGNGIFYIGLSQGGRKEVPGVHFDEPYDDVTIIVYLTPDLPADCGTSLWRHRATGIEHAPMAGDARRLGIPLQRLRDRFEREAERRACWEEIDRAGYRYNRLVAYPSGLMHSATRHFGGSVGHGRVYQTFRVGIDWQCLALAR
jgi:Family of unknown function (DUF6445)